MTPKKTTEEWREKREFWITPPELYKRLDDEFHFDFDPCPYPFSGVDGTEIEWGNTTYLNPPFRKSDGHFDKGPTAFIRKAIEENKKGKTVVITINTNAFINMLIEAGAEMRSLGRVKWLDGKTNEPWKSPSNTTLFILRSEKNKQKLLSLERKRVAEEIVALIEESKAWNTSETNEILRALISQIKAKYLTPTP